MKLKVIGEHTRQTDAHPLCLTCTGSLVVRGTRFGDDTIHCRYGLGRVKFHVTDCSGYDDARVIPVYRLEETAWRMFEGRFVSPSEMRHLVRTKQAPDPDDD